MASGYVLQSQDLSAMLLKALGGQAGSGHLTPIIYRPIVSFTDAAGQVRAVCAGISPLLA
jgi:hypothetical protein